MTILTRVRSRLQAVVLPAFIFVYCLLSNIVLVNLLIGTLPLCKSPFVQTRG
jgi:hypothetical protein